MEMYVLIMVSATVPPGGPQACVKYTLLNVVKLQEREFPKRLL